MSTHILQTKVKSEDRNRRDGRVRKYFKKQEKEISCVQVTPNEKEGVRKRKITFYFENEHNHHKFKISDCKRSVFDFEKQSSLIYCNFRVYSKKAKGSDELKNKIGQNNEDQDENFVSCFRFHIPIRKNANQVSKSHSLCLRYRNWSVIQDFHNSVFVELLKKFPKGNFDIMSITTEKGDVLDDETCFSFDKFLNLKSKFNLFEIKVLRLQEPIKVKLYTRISISEMSFYQHLSAGLVEQAKHVLSKYTANVDITLSLEKILPLFFTNPNKFFDSSMKIVLKIQKKLTYSKEESFFAQSKVVGKKESITDHINSKLLDVLDILNDEKSTKAGRLTSEFLFDIIARMMTSAMNLKRYIDVFNLGSRIKVHRYTYPQNTPNSMMKQTLAFQYNTAISIARKQKVITPANWNVILGVFPRMKSDSSSFLVYSRSKIDEYVKDFLQHFRKNPYNLLLDYRIYGIRRKTADSDDDSDDDTDSSINVKMGKKNDDFMEHLDTSQTLSVIMSYIAYTREMKGKSRSSELGKYVPTTITIDQIPIILEAAYLYLHEKSFDVGFEIIYFLCYVAITMTHCEPHTDKEMSDGKREGVSPSYFSIHHYFGVSSNPFFAKPIFIERIYKWILFDSFLSKHKKVHAYITKNSKDHLFPPKRIFFDFAKLLWSRGELDLAEEYIKMAIGEDKFLTSKVKYAAWKARVSLNRGKLGEARQAAFFPLLLKKGKKIQSLIFDSGMISVDLALELMSKKYERSDDDEEEELFRFPNIHAPKGMYIILGGSKLETDNEGDRNLKFLEQKLEDHEHRREPYRKRGRRPHGKRLRYDINRKKQNEVMFLRSRYDPDFMELLYTLPLIAFLERDFHLLEKWIVVLSELEFCHESYGNQTRNSHILYQVIANLYYFEHTRIRNNLPSCYFTESSKKSGKGGEDRVIYVIGDSQILPFAHRIVELRGKPHRLVPIFIDGIRLIHLTQISKNPYKECLLERIEKISQSYVNIPKKSTTKKKGKKGNRSQPSSSSGTRRKCQFIFMIGEADLRSRILNSSVADSDVLHTQFCESSQVELLCDIYMRFLFQISKENNKKKNMGKIKIGMSPVFPMLHVMEQHRTLKLQSRFGTRGTGVGNRIQMFNSLMKERCRKSSGRVQYLDGLEDIILSKDRNCVDMKFDLGCGAFLNPNPDDDGLFMKEFESSLERNSSGW